MTDFSDFATAARAVADPSCSAADLADIARRQPSLRAQVAAHANAYPALVQWLATYGDPSVQAVAAARLAGVQPAASPTPQAPYPMAPAPYPMMPRRSNRPLIIGVAGVVVLAVILTLIIAHPWQPAGGPQLTTRQFIWMLQNESQVADTYDFGGYSASDLTNQISFDPTNHQWQEDLANCPATSEFRTAMQGLRALANNSSDTSSNIQQLVLFNTAQNAKTALTASAQDSQSSQCNVVPKSTTTVQGVTFLWLGATATNYGGGSYAQYGNVLFYEYGILAQDQWQAEASTLKNAVDQAAKH
ncbi:MAG: hypothetical protein FWD80_05555 [Propionibacteriaceae bacterium]|nr:hypothetical protein [Propionibacteriaceae bacterium]